MDYKIEKSICPLCHQPNACQKGKRLNCWCKNIETPRDLLEKISSKKEQSQCACFFCIQEYKEKQKRKKRIWWG